MSLSKYEYNVGRVITEEVPIYLQSTLVDKESTNFDKDLSICQSKQRSEQAVP